MKGKNVLELGCGDGENTVLLAHRGARVCGVDLSDAMVKLARRRAQVNGFVQGVELGVGWPMSFRSVTGRSTWSSGWPC